MELVFMQQTEYSIWDFHKVTTGSELTIYYNDFLVMINLEITTRNFPSSQNWTQIGTMNVGSNYAPYNTQYLETGFKDLQFRVLYNGNIEYRNTGSGLTSPIIRTQVTYPRKSALP